VIFRPACARNFDGGYSRLNAVLARSAMRFTHSTNRADAAEHHLVRIIFPPRSRSSSWRRCFPRLGNTTDGRFRTMEPIRQVARPLGATAAQLLRTSPCRLPSQSADRLRGACHALIGNCGRRDVGSCDAYGYIMPFGRRERSYRARLMRQSPHRRRRLRSLKLKMIEARFTSGALISLRPYLVGITD